MYECIYTHRCIHKDMHTRTHKHTHISWFWLWQDTQRVAKVKCRKNKCIYVLLLSNERLKRCYFEVALNWRKQTWMTHLTSSLKVRLLSNVILDSGVCTIIQRNQPWVHWGWWGNITVYHLHNSDKTHYVFALPHPMEASIVRKVLGPEWNLVALHYRREPRRMRCYQVLLRGFCSPDLASL